MKQLHVLIFLLIVTGFNSVSYSQDISAGLYSGLNLSDIHGQDIGGKWSFQPGPVQGISLGYSFFRTIGIQTGVSFSTVYYDHEMPLYENIPYPGCYPLIAPPYYYPPDNRMDFRFLRIPLQLSLSIPAVVQLKIEGGLFYSHLLDYNLEDFNYIDDSYKPEKDDFGYIFSSGISYPLTDNFRIALNAAYITGRKRFIEDYQYRHGSSEYTMGISYTGSLKDKDKDKGIAARLRSDTLSMGINITFTAGFNYSWNKGYENLSGYTSPSAGFSVDLPLGEGGSFQTGFLFQKKGYSLRDSSISFYRYIEEEGQMYYVNTKVQIDYAILQALWTFPLGSQDIVFFSTGPWFGFRLNARNTGTAYYDYHSTPSYRLIKTIVYDDLEKAVKVYDVGWTFGCGVLLPVVNDYKVSFSFRYSPGFRDVFDISGTGETQNPYQEKFKIRNRTISFVVGLRMLVPGN